MHKSVTTLTAGVTAGVLLALAGATQAATKTDSFQVSATVSKNCVIDAPDLNLGIFDGANDLVASSTISVRCTNLTAFNVDLSTGSSADYTTRTLRNGPTDLLNYNLYAAAASHDDLGRRHERHVRGSGTGAGMSAAQSLTVYGRLLASNNIAPVAAGSYVDNLIATITY